MNTWSVYLLRCGDDSIYTGITVNVARRLEQHQNSHGAKYLRGRSPLTLIYSRAVGNRSLASRIEYRLRRMPRDLKADPGRVEGFVNELLQEFRAVSEGSPADP